MADYYPLIARAIAGLGPDSTAQARQHLYERASRALIGQLRSLDPPMSDDEIERERLALDGAIRQVEDEALGQSAPAPTLPLASEPAAPAAPVGKDADHPSGPLEHGQPAVPVAAFEAEAQTLAQPEILPEQPDPPQPRHPQAPRPEAADRRWVRGAVVAGGIAVVVAVTGYAAWRLRDKASDFQQPVAGPSVQEQKFADRLGEAGGPPPNSQTQTPQAQSPQAQSPQAQVPPAASPPTPPAQAPLAPASGPGATGSPPAVAPQSTPAPVAPLSPSQVTVLQRAVMLEEPVEAGQPPRATIGTVLWKLDTVPGGDGGVVDNAVHATLDLSNSGIMGELVMRKNRDPALPASHTIEARFETNEKSVNGKIRDMSLPEMRADETQRGVPLAGLPVPVMENLVLIGLSSLPADVERNLDLLRTRNWFAVLVRFTNNKRALLIFEKGPPGERVMQDAMSAWTQ
jgi:hypothetical protein